MQGNDQIDIVAQRTLTRRDEDGNDVPVLVSIMRPYPIDDGRSYFCPFDVRGLPEPPSIPGSMGVDAVHALMLAFQVIGITLYTSKDFKAGRLRWLDDPVDLGFPRS